MHKMFYNLVAQHKDSKFPLVEMDPVVRAAKEKKLQHECTQRLLQYAKNRRNNYEQTPVIVNKFREWLHG